MFRATRIETDVHTECLREPLKESRRGPLWSLGHCSYLGQIGRASSGTPETCKEDLAIETELLILRLLPLPPPQRSARRGRGGAWAPGAVRDLAGCRRYVQRAAAMPEAVHLGDLLRIWVRPARSVPLPPAGRAAERKGRSPPRPATRSLPVAPAPSAASEGAW